MLSCDDSIARKDDLLGSQGHPGVSRRRAWPMIKRYHAVATVQGQRVSVRDLGRDDLQAGNLNQLRIARAELLGCLGEKHILQIRDDFRGCCMSNHRRIEPDIAQDVVAMVIGADHVTDGPVTQ